MHARAWCEIDLDALRHNAAQLAARAGVPLVAMVKSDAYGQGIEAVARALNAEFEDGPAPVPGGLATRKAGLWGLGIATLREGEELRALGCRSRVLCCMPLLPEALPAAAAARITPSLDREMDIRSWRRLGDAPWHLAIDTGMNRAGLDWRTAAELRAVVAEFPPEGVFTHFHSPELANGSLQLQEARFATAIEALALPADVLTHADATFSLQARVPEGYALARPGIGLFGSPSTGLLNLRPVVHVYARVLEVREVPVGDTVSYGGTWTATRTSRVATIAVGHADGYRRAFANCGRMLLAGRYVPVVGSVSMDVTMVDVTEVPCQVGDVATVLGQAWPRGNSVSSPVRENGPVLTIDDLAGDSGLSSYELLVGWRMRLIHVYRGAAW